MYGAGIPLPRKVYIKPTLLGVMAKRNGKAFESWEEYIEFAHECDQDPLFKKALDKFVEITA